jgi:hypothetical protein
MISTVSIVLIYALLIAILLKLNQVSKHQSAMSDVITGMASSQIAKNNLDLLKTKHEKLPLIKEKAINVCSDISFFLEGKYQIEFGIEKDQVEFLVFKNEDKEHRRESGCIWWWTIDHFSEIESVNEIIKSLRKETYFNQLMVNIAQ